MKGGRNDRLTTWTSLFFLMWASEALMHAYSISLNGDATISKPWGATRDMLCKDQSIEVGNRRRLATSLI